MLNLMLLGYKLTTVDARDLTPEWVGVYHYHPGAIMIHTEAAISEDAADV